LIAEQLGKKEGQTDYLAISFSANDAVGHHFGPNSLEAEDTLLMLDKTLAHLLDVIDREVGLNRTLVVLTADHGVSDSPGYLQDHHLVSTAALSDNNLEKQLQHLLKEKYHLPEKTLLAVNLPFVYLDHQIIENQNMTVEKLSKKIARFLARQSGVYNAYPLSETVNASDWLGKKIQRMAHPQRAGDIYVVQQPYQYRIKNGQARVSHGSPWNYDSYVPLIFSQPAFKAIKVVRPVATIDIASTLSMMLSVKPPSASVGIPLTEVIEFSNNKT
jgi:predicted AlkP superfamily pyrophosphatase or phosphodiesterase